MPRSGPLPHPRACIPGMSPSDPRDAIDLIVVVFLREQRLSSLVHSRVAARGMGLVKCLVTSSCCACSFAQIHHEFERFKTYLKSVKVALFYGGEPITSHKDALKKEVPSIVVGTPGRIKQVGGVLIASISCFCLADRSQCKPHFSNTMHPLSRLVSAVHNIAPQSQCSAIVMRPR